jgi:hypothetical protein
MGRKKKAESGNVVVDAAVMDATNKIARLCAKKGLVPTDKYAVLKSLQKAGSCATAEQHYTRWAQNKDGERGLVVLNSDDKIKFYTDYKTHFNECKTIH